MAGTLVPSFTFGPTGFIAPQPTAVLAGVQGDVNAAFGNSLNYNLNTPQGQIASSEAAVINNTYATFQFYSQQVDPAYATGRFQDAIGRIYFMQRNPSQPTQLQISCSGANVTIPFGALIQDSVGNLYSCATFGGGTISPSGGSITLQFNCTVPGPIAVPASNAVTIYTTIPGWDSVGVISGVLGVNVEGRQAFETRREDSVAGNSFGAIGSIIGAVAKVANVVDYFGYSNNSNSPVTVFGVTIPANSIYVTVAGGAQSDIAQAILTKKGAGAPMAGNTTVTAFDSNPLYATPIPYQITWETPTAIQIIVSVILVNNPSIPSNAATLIQNALIAAMTGQSSLIPAPPKIRIGTTIFIQNYAVAIVSLGSWAQINSLQIGSINTNPTTFFGNIASNTLTIHGSVTGPGVAINQFIFDSDNRVINGTEIISGSGTSWTVNNTQTVGGAGGTGNTSGSSVNVTMSTVAGAIGIGDLIVGSGIPANTTIVSQTSGIPGGSGVYVMSAAANLVGIACTFYAAFTTVAAASNSTNVNANQLPQISAPTIVVTAQ